MDHRMVLMGQAIGALSGTLPYTLDAKRATAELRSLASSTAQDQARLRRSTAADRSQQRRTAGPVTGPAASS